MKQFFKNIATGLYNFWFFRKVIWNFRWYDYSYNLDLFQRSIQYTCLETETKGTHKSLEESVHDMRRVIWLLEKVRSDEFITEAECIVGYELKGCDCKPLENGKGYELVDAVGTDKVKSKKVIDLARKLEEENWQEIWKIIDRKMRNWWD